MGTLEGVYAKITRAQAILRDLEADIAVVCELERRQIVFEHQHQVGVWAHDPPEVPVDYSIRIGEIAHNLRSALDHLVWQLVLTNGGCPGKSNQFPICRDEKEFRKNADRKLEGVASIHRGCFEEFQPYRGNGGIGAHLSMLNIICNIDKHRRLNVVSLYSMTESWKEKIEPIVDVCLTDKDVGRASVGYGSDIETTGMNRAPVARVLSSCLAAVIVVVEHLTTRNTPNLPCLCP